MKTTASFTLALAASVLAAQDWDPLPNKRDVQTISMVIMQTTTALQQLDTSVKAFDGQDFNKLASDATNVKNVLDSSTQQIQATSPISAQDAITLQSSLTPIQQTATSLLTDLNAKKPQVQQASICQIVQQQTQGIATSANALLQATVSKIPQNLQAVATQLTGQFTQQLSDTSLTFSPGNCTNAAGGAGAGITFSNSSATSSSGTASSTNGIKSGASTQVASAFGVLLAGAVGFMMM